MSLLSDALQTHLALLGASAGVTITYSRGSDSVMLTATPGETRFEALDQNGNVVQITSQDFVVKQADLVLGGSVITPDRNDKITHDGVEYRLLQDFGLQHYRATDAYGKGYRLHTKRIYGS